MAEPRPSHEPLSRQSLERCTEAVLRHASGVKPAIVLVRAAGRRAVVKDFAANPWLVRQTYGRWLVGRETRIYARLDGVDGVPVFRGRLDAYAFVVDYIDGKTLKVLDADEIPALAFDRLAGVFDQIHARGVVHLDSHQKTNILLSPDGRPYLLDFATALRLGTGWLGRRLLVPLLGRPDYWGVLKLKARYCPEALTDRERRRLRRGEALAWLWPPQWFRWLAKRLRHPRRRRKRRTQP